MSQPSENPSVAASFAAPLATSLRHHAEQSFAEELAVLARLDDRPRPPGWTLSPWAVRAYILGGRLPGGFEVSPKYIGRTRLVEIAVATLATDRALLLQGVPGTGKSWLSEHLAAAICGDSTLIVQGTAGTDESTLRYGWNYARLLAEGPTPDAIVPSPIMRAMQLGRIARVEELSRIPSEVQDSLITALSEKALPVAELGVEVQARQGFNLIATSNDRDRGVNEPSAALTRRFNTVILPLPEDAEEEVRIVAQRVRAIGSALALPTATPALAEIQRVVTIFRELRRGVTEDGRTRLKSPSGTLSTAEMISSLVSGMAMAGYYGDGELRAADLAASVSGAILRDPVQDSVAFQEYLRAVVKEREGWMDLYRAFMELV